MIIDFIQTNWVEILGALFGLLYLYFEYNVNIKMWPTGILMSVFYTYVFIYTKFYAFAIINIYYIIAGIYGWIKWNKAKNNNKVDDTKPIQTPTRLYLYILLSIGIIFSVISYILANYTDSQVIYGDSFITTLSIVSMWMLAHKYVEQWLLVIVLNFVSTIIYFQQNLYPTSIMYLIYAVVSILGYIKWKQLANEKQFCPMKYYNLPNRSTAVDAVILANGDFPTHPIALSILNNSRNIICCDGAIDNLSKTNIQPHAIVGDCDSLSAVNKQKYSTIIHQINEQETNDLTKSVKYCIEKGFTNLIILGATGKREDHTIANISLLSEYIDMVENISMITNYGIFNAINQYSDFESFNGQQVSLFCISPTEVTVHGLKYPIDKVVFTNWWQATLNESISTKFKVESSDRLIVYRVF